MNLLLPFFSLSDFHSVESDYKITNDNKQFLSSSFDTLAGCIPHPNNLDTFVLYLSGKLKKPKFSSIHDSIYRFMNVAQQNPWYQQKQVSYSSERFE